VLDQFVISLLIMMLASYAFFYMEH
jgi:hypothetical protein